MVRYQFSADVKDYLTIIEGNMSEATFKSVRRRLKQMGRILNQMKDEKLISSDNPKNINDKDILAYVGYRKKNGISGSTVHKDLSILESFLYIHNNNAVAQFRIKYRGYVPKAYNGKLAPMSDELVEKIFEKAMKLDVSQWKLMESYAAVILAISAGLRPKEIRMAYADNLELYGNGATIYIEHVKGEEPWRRSRPTPFLDGGGGFMKRYLEAREIKLKTLNVRTRVLFPLLRDKAEFVSHNSLFKLKINVEQNIEEKFELRCGRRTFGQSALDSGQELHDTSIAMGHASIVTTQKYYADRKQSVAVSNMLTYSKNCNSSITKKCVSESNQA
jgi:site-specific recombinase XerD